MKLCLSIFRTLSVHYRKGQLIPEEFYISEQNIGSPGSNCERQTAFRDSLSLVADPTHSIIRTV